MTTSSFSLSATTGTIGAGLAQNSAVFVMRLNPTASYYADSYSETNADTETQVNVGGIVGVAQTFAGATGTLQNVKLYLRKFGLPTGNAVAKIYAVAGYSGTAGIPTGTALATSANLDVSTLTTSQALTTIAFSGANQIQLQAGTTYALTIEYASGDGSNYLRVAFDASTPTHLGNYSNQTGAVWTPVAGRDMIFYVTVGGGANATTTAVIDRIHLQYVTLVAYTTPVTVARALSLYHGFGAMATGGTSITPPTKRDSSVGPGSNNSQFEPALGAGGIMVATTGALTVSGITFDVVEFSKHTLSHVGAAGNFYEYINTTPGIKLRPGELLAVRNPVAMDAAGTWQLNVSIDWTEFNSF